MKTTIRGLLVLVLLATCCTAAHAGPFKSIGRFFGLGWSDGYHARNGYMYMPYHSAYTHSHSQLPSHTPPAMQPKPEGGMEPQPATRMLPAPQPADALTLPHSRRLPPGLLPLR